MAAIISSVEQGSLAAEVGIEEGDVLLSIDGEEITDIIAYRYLTAAKQVRLLIEKAGERERWEIEVEKDEYEDLGLGFTDGIFDGLRRCVNHCLFCFVDQQPPGLRESLAFKDDDYRLSFMHGNFITLTNLHEKDWERIERFRISPLYISVHSTVARVRECLLGNRRAGDILSQLQRLVRMGIQFHTQIVVCPGFNDGDVLSQTVDDLVDLWPHLLSVAVVPVGLTRYRPQSSPVRAVSREEAAEIVAFIHGRQQVCRERYGTRLVWAADELYMKAGLRIPGIDHYENLPQLENGVGIAASTRAEFDKAAPGLPDRVSTPIEISLVSGFAGSRIVSPWLARLYQIEGLSVTLYSVPSRFFGGTVDVTGLLTGSDLVSALRGHSLGSCVVVPRVMLKQDEPIMLDDMTLDQLSQELGTEIRVVSGPADLVRFCQELAGVGDGDE